jgi:amino acid adenylation domain-containing protein
MQQLAGVQPLELPTDRARPAVMSHAGASVRFTIGSQPMEHLKALSRRQGTSLYMVFLAAFQTLLFRYSGQQDIAVGSPIAGRRRTETEGLIGFFVNTLVMRTDVSGGRSFTGLLRQVREVALEAYTHQDVPFEKVVEELQPERDLSRTPLFQVMFALQNTPRSELQLGAVQPRPFDVDHQTAKFDLNMAMSEDGEKMQGWVGYNAELFEPATVARMIGHYCVLLSGVVGNPEQLVAELPLLEEAERQQLLVEWNKRAVYDPQKCLPEMFEEQVAATPTGVAVEYEDRGLTYAELNRRANQLGHYLKKLRVGPEVRVGIRMERGLDMVIAILGVLKAGGAYVPLDPNYPAERVAYMLEDSQARVLLLDEHAKEARPQFDGIAVELQRDKEKIEQESSSQLNLKITPENIAYVIYTSGSTGRPKGVMVSHGNVAWLMRQTEPWFQFDERDVWTLFHSYAFDFSVWELWGALLYGGRLVVVPYWVTRSPEEFLDLLVRKRVTVLNQTPSAFQQLMRAEEEKGGMQELALRLVIFGGEALEFQSLRSWLERHPQRPQLVNMYGITETTVHVTYHPVSLADVQENEGRSSIGVAIADLQVFVLDEWMQLAPVGVKGEMYVGGGGLARGYLNRPELTAERFVPNPFAAECQGERLYRSGDQARWRNDGSLEYFGRLDQQVKIRGFRIELGEIEAALKEQAGVAQAVVIAREDSPEGKRLVAYVVPAPEFGIDHAVLRRNLGERLPDYMVPAAFVPLDALPLTPNGKLDRKALPAPELQAESHQPPRTPEEEILCLMFAELLSRERVGIYDNFFELGGHSLLTFRLKTMIRKHFDCDLPLASLFRNPTVAGLAKLLETPANEPSSPILAPMQTNGSSAPFFCVHPVGGQVVCYADLSRELGQNQPFYGLQSPDPSQTQVATIEHMASLYIQEIRHIQPSGPYLLGGWSMGGLVAFEMAHQLIDQGETIDLLTLFDMVPPSEFSGEIEPKRSFSMLERFALDMARLVLRNADELREHFLQLGPEEQFKLILDVLVREGVLPEASGQFELNRLLDIFTRNASAVENYRLRPMKQRIVLFAAAGREDPEQLAEKWEPWTTGGVELRAVQGDHYTILKPPHVATIASDLKHYLKSEHAVAVSQ